jgi:hypothetical protein
MIGQSLNYALLPVAVLILGMTGCSRGGEPQPGTDAPDAPHRANAASANEAATNGRGQSDSSGAKEDKGSGTQNLFIIERSKNANIVRYDAQFTEEGELNPKEPVIAYWILHAEKGQRAELSYLQKKMAYGFETKPATSGEGYTMTMVPLPKRELRIKVVDGEAQGQIEINGKPAVLEKIYVDSEPGWTGPDVNYVRLIGRDLETDEKLTEKITP